MEIVVFVVFLAIYLGLCWLVARYAANRGWKFVWGFIVSLLAGPLIAFIIYALIGRAQS